MVSLTLKIKGDLTAGLDALETAVSEKALISGAAAAARVFYEEARGYVPVHTGLLKSAIYRVYSKSNSSPTRAVYHISWNHGKAPHGWWIEYGNSRIPAKPFITPAFNHADRAMKAGIERIKEVLEGKLKEEDLGDTVVSGMNEP